ncbi:hypothetical protein A616_28755 [Brevibacillus brevis X23]|nr:hypothetical protein A616_28755 [Brevibacillus brevis X23]
MQYKKTYEICCDAELFHLADKIQKDIDHNMEILNTSGLNEFNKRELKYLIEKYTFSLKSVKQVLNERDLLKFMKFGVVSTQQTSAVRDLF